MERYVVNNVQDLLAGINCSLQSLCLMKIEEMKKQGYEIKMEWLPGGNFTHDEVVEIIGREYLPPKKGLFK